MVPIVDEALKLINKYVPDPTERAKAESELRSNLFQWDLSQNQVNAVEASNTSLFVSGWRPFIGWICGSALFYQYLLTPIVMWLAPAFGYFPPQPPKLDDSLWQLMFGILGMAGLRTYERLKGVAR